MEATQQWIDVSISKKQYHQVFEGIKRFYRNIITDSQQKNRLCSHQIQKDP
jgi:hypothetical protein